MRRSGSYRGAASAYGRREARRSDPAGQRVAPPQRLLPGEGAHRELPHHRGSFPLTGSDRSLAAKTGALPQLVPAHRTGDASARFFPSILSTSYWTPPISAAATPAIIFQE